MKIRLLVLLFLLITVPCWAADYHIYIDSAAAAGGAGTEASPFDAFADINWTTAANAITAGDTVQINLKRGSIFRETLTVAASGASGRPIVIQTYGTGAKPVIDGSDVITSWTDSGAGLGSTWQATCGAVASNNVYYQGTRMQKGSSATTLNNKEWFQNGTTLYFRLDEGNPDTLSRVIHLEQRSAIVNSNRQYITYQDIDLMRAIYGISLANTTSNSTYTRIRLIDCHYGISTSSTSVNCLVQYCEFIRGGTGGNVFASVGGATNAWVFKYCTFRDILGRSFFIQYGASFSIHNCIFTGNLYSSETVRNTAATATVDIKNSIFMPGGIVSTAGTATIENSLLSYSILGGNNVSGFTIGAGVSYVLPKYAQPGMTGLMSWTVDDGDITYAINGSRALKAASSAFGGFTLADIGTNGMGADSTRMTNVSTLLSLSGEVAGHTRDFVGDITNLSALKIYCSNYGTSTTVTASIAENVLTTTVDGSPDVSIDLTNASYDKLSEVITYLHGKAGAAGVVYACTNAGSTATTSVASYTLADVTDANLRVASPGTAFNFDQTRYWTEEIVNSRTDIETAIGNGYTAPTFIYPQGGVNAALRTFLAANNFLGGRTAGTAAATGMYLRNLSLWDVYGTAAPAIQGTLFVSKEANGTDTSGNGYAFTAVNHGTHYGDYYELPTSFGFSANLTAGNAYLHRAALAKLDYRNADWSVGMIIKPSRLTGAETYTLWYHGDSSGTDNYSRLWLSADGAAHFSIVVGGVESVRLDSAAGVFTTSTARKICVRQLLGKIQMFSGAGAVASRNDANLISSTLLTETTTSVVPGAGAASYTGSMYFATSSDGAGGVVNTYYGYLGTIFMGQDTARLATGMAVSLASTGQVMAIMHHSDVPYDIIKTYADAINYAIGIGYDVKPKNFKDAMAYITAHGELTSDKMFVRWNQTDTADYQLTATSPAINAGADLSYTLDLAGAVVPNGAAPDIGAYEYYAPVVPPSTSSPTRHRFGFYNSLMFGF